VTLAKNIFKALLGEKVFKKVNFLKNEYVTHYTRKIYSQDGEDIILKEFLKGAKKGFYIDVGAHHPMKFSNTYLFYKMGWCGINIDPLPGSMRLFEKNRKRDINLELGVSEKETEMIYYMFEQPALNGFSKDLSERRMGENKIIGKKRIKTIPLYKVLDENLPKNKKIDFMNIDVEGLDFEVLKSNNWNKYKPDFILIEIHENEVTNVIKSSIYKYLSNLDYSLVAKTYRTCIFKLKK
jgi:FkbM family methyltransferase